jgi:RNA 2',3'-cyclic 3'-phosphodiesterase
VPAIRAFIAIELPPTIHEQLERISRELQAACKIKAIRWVPVKNIHLTLQFLGEVSPTNLPPLTKALQGEIARHLQFDVTVQGSGAFPTLHRPRVIWIGIQAPPDLLSLQKGIEIQTKALGFKPEDRDFSPHLTLARLSQYAMPEEIRRTGDVLANYNAGILGAFRAGAVSLFQSDLFPGGPVYTSLFKAPLAISSNST